MPEPQLTHEQVDVFAITMSEAAFGGDAEASGVQQAISGEHAAPIVPDRAIGEALGRHGHAWTEGAGLRYAMIGSSGAAQVWTASDATLMRQVAIKALAPGRTTAGHIAAFVAEARLTAALQHPHVPPVHDLLVGEDGRPCFIMKAVEGMTLGVALRQAATGETPTVISTINGVINAFIAISQALSFAHHQGIVHQDVKPDNILLGRFGEVLLLDWGCARRRDDAQARIFGTPYYMSPEQARRERSNEQSDVYCVGASLFHALIRRTPLTTRPVATFWDLKRRGVIDQPTQAERARVPQPLLAIVLKAIAADPGKRYPTIDALVAELQAYQSGLAVVAHRDSLWQAVSRWGYRHRAALIAALVICVSVIVARIMIERERARERAQWILVAADDFTGGNDATAKQWQVIQNTTSNAGPYSDIALGSAGATVANGRLEIGLYGSIVNALWRTNLAGDLRVTWTCTPLVNGLNLNCFLGENRRKGIGMQVGAWGDARYAAIYRDGVEMIDYRYLEQPLVAGKTCAFMLERENGQIRLTCNGELILQTEDVSAGDAMASTSFGVDAYSESRLAIDDVKIFAKPLPDRISPLAVGGRLFSLGLFAEARRQFLELARLRPGQEAGIEAAYHAAVCLGRLGVPEADAELLAFITAYPGHLRADQAQFERYLVAEASGQRELIDARCQDMLAVADQRLRQRLIARLGTEMGDEMKQRAKASYRSFAEREAFVEFMLTEARRIHEWARRFNVRLQRQDFLERIDENLRIAGRSRVALDICPSEAPGRIESLVDLAQMDEALAVSVNFLNEQALVQETLGRFTDLTRSLRQRPKILGWFRLANIEQLAIEDPWGPYLGDATLDGGHLDEVIAEPRWPMSVRARAMARRGQWQPIADGNGAGFSQEVEALCHVNREAEALEHFHWDIGGMGIVAAFRWQRGDLAGCRELIESMEATPPNYTWRSTLYTHFIMPVVLRARMGDADPAKRLVNLEDWQREALSSRLAVLSAYITGAIDEESCRSQLLPLCRESLIQVAKAARAELAGDLIAARAAWQAILDTPSSQLLEYERLLPMASVLAAKP